jgi:D-amino peptidase
MRIAVSVDMDGASQLRGVREIFGCFPEYWATGRPRLEADVVAACEGLLAGGASELILLDNHGGNTVNFAPEALPHGARTETWHVYDLPAHGIDAMFQVGYHARGGIDGFLSHTYMPGLRLRVDGEPISESHGRAWAAQVPLLGITGNDRHLETLGSLAHTPYLVVQRSQGRAAMTPVFDDPARGFDEIRSFAEVCARTASSRPAIVAPSGVRFEASMPNGSEVVETMSASGWQRVGEVEFAFEVEEWSTTREPLAAAMNAALSPFMPYWLGAFPDAAATTTVDPTRLADLATVFDAWAAESHPQWYTSAVDALPADAREQLAS